MSIIFLIFCIVYHIPVRISLYADQWKEELLMQNRENNQNNQNNNQKNQNNNNQNNQNQRNQNERNQKESRK